MHTMPKRKKLPPLPDYVGAGGNHEKLLIQKSNPLLTLSETDITLPELKILDAYLSRINSHDPDKRLVRFEKGELEKLLGNTWMHKDDLEKRLRNLFQVVEIVDERYPKQINLISLFEKASCTQDEDGLWQVDLMCTPSAMEYIFNVENLGYLKYRLKSVVNLTSRYSYVLYLFLESNCYRGKIEVSLDDLKKMLNCMAETYKEYKRLNDLILKKCHKEINEKTDISYTYTTIKNGRKVVAISFEVERKPRTEVSIESIKQELHEIEPPKAEEPPVEEDKYDGYESEDILQYAVICKCEFNNAQMKEICQIISETDVPEEDFNTSRTFREYDFLCMMYYKLCNYTDPLEMNNKRRFAYFIKMLKSYKAEHPIM